MPPLLPEDLETEGFENSSQKGLNLRPLLRTIRRQSLWVVGITTLFTSAAYFLILISAPIYRGSFRLLVEPVTTEGRITEPTAVTRSNGVPHQDIFRLDYPTQIEILKSPGVLSDVVERIQQVYPTFALVQLNNQLGVDRLGRDSRILEVTYEGTDPNLVLTVLHQTADKYLQYSLQERKSRINEGVKFIDEQLPELRTRADALQDQLQQLQQQYSFFDPAQEGDTLSAQLLQVNEQLEETNRQLKEQRQLYTTIQEQLGLSPKEALAALALNEDPVYQELRNEIQELDNQIAIESTRFNPQTPMVEALEAQRQSLTPLLRERGLQTLGPNLGEFINNPRVQSFQDSTRRDLIAQLVSINNSIEQLEVRSASLANRQAALEQEIEGFPSISRQYQETQRQLELVNRTLNQLLDQREKLRVEAAQTQVPWELIADPQISPPDHNAGKILFLGGFTGLLAGIGCALWIEKRRDIFYTSEEMQEVLPAPFLEIIPHLKVPHAQSSTTDLLLQPEGGAISPRKSEPFAFNEAFNSLYAKILFFYPERPIRSLVISSPTASDGKTTVALHLAKTAAATGQRVLVVEANLRLPQLQMQLNLPPSPGLKQLLSDPQPANWQQQIQRSPLSDNLFILAAGEACPDAAQLLASDRMQELMQALRESFDLVIYDTPRLQGFTDAKFVAANTDGILLVVRVAQTHRSTAIEAIDELNAFNLPILGIIANEGRDDNGSPASNHPRLAASPAQAGGEETRGSQSTSGQRS